jgi:hypothetical protein
VESFGHFLRISIVDGKSILKVESLIN